MKLSWSLVLSSAAAATASYSGNLNYRSPSEHHPGLGVSIHRVAKRGVPGSSFDPSKLHFTHGVASGDPYADSVILWTRCSPTFDDVHSNTSTHGLVPLYNPVPIYSGNEDAEEQVAVSNAPVCLDYKVSDDESFKQIAAEGTVYTSSDIDYTVKVEASKLKPFTTYFYQFQVCNSDNKSPVGRTKTAPDSEKEVDQVNLAVYSCANFPFGFFNAYGHSVRKDSVDYVVHLGDYLYEYKNGEYGWGNSMGRIPLPDRTIVTLYDYRKRLATYRTDLDLLASHQNFAWIPVWDDHEVADNTYRDGSSELRNDEKSFIQDGGVSVDQRKMNAVRAYFEWMPIRQVEMDDNLRIWRNFKLGKLVDLIMLDTRQYDRSITDTYDNTNYIDEIKDDAGRSLMGSRQENWLQRNLIESANRGAHWRILGSQIIFSQLNMSATMGPEQPLNLDAWDGYMASKNRTLQTLYDNKIGNNIVIAGDTHVNWVSDLAWLDHTPYDSSTGSGSIGVEFGGAAVSSPSSFGQNTTIPAANNISQIVATDSESLQWSEGYYRGYFELHITPEQVGAHFFGLPTTKERNFGEISLANFTVKSGENHLQRNSDNAAAGGIVENGFLKNGKVVQSGMVYDTETGRYYSN
ncbi:hypothetical protein E8E15_000859 [Penicillium rubens]|uniref:uncharacterized protein n=1 Tax=Penicillium rubens TaxID=1108849 RepID=UPI001D82D696|nr:uncharacterized protein N7525_001068 [Penicillium rubens]KAF3010414.1 hypothetical protein E8E15_000859 [Penicillium rubens]KAJ5039236.1 hypothetical protein NUH16_009017 [Penicillium rubens]KAJ5843327.1 hypothetical protein N7525_001068 [Penicillium rubens]